MSAVLMKDHPPDEARGSNACNRLHIRRTAMAQDGWTAEPRIVPRRESLRVLIVDDYRASADTMSMLIGTWGHDVRRAYDGATGLALAAAYQPDVLLLDIIMPEISGFEMAMQVRRQSRLSDCLLELIPQP
jgi:PleD family two-component response regulator